MPTLTLLVASIAVADSINPSTLLPALWMVSASRSHLGSFTLGVFVVYLAGGLVLVFGPGPALMSAMHDIGATGEHSVQGAGGGALLALVGGVSGSRGSQGLRALAQPAR